MKRTLGVLLLVLCLAPAVPAYAQKAVDYLDIPTGAVADVFAKRATNLTCSSGVWISGPHTGLREHIIHIGPLGWCGTLLLGSGDYHIVSVEYRYTAGGRSYIPKGDAYDGGDPSGRKWQALATPETKGKEITVVEWQDVDGDGLLGKGDHLVYDDGTTAAVDSIGSAIAVER